MPIAYTIRTVDGSKGRFDDGDSFFKKPTSHAPDQSTPSPKKQFTQGKHISPPKSYELYHPP